MMAVGNPRNLGTRSYVGQIPEGKSCLEKSRKLQKIPSPSQAKWKIPKFERRPPII
jgi:hypothetical protein